MGYRPICPVNRCPEKTVTRLADKGNSRRVDLCFRHAIVSLRDYGDDIDIVDTWNGTTKEQLELAVKQLREFNNE